MAAQDTSELFPLAREVLFVGIRLASQVNLHMKLIDQSTESWGVTYTGVSSATIRSILERFHKDYVCATPSVFFYVLTNYFLGCPRI